MDGVTELVVSTPAELLELATKLGRHVFRGQGGNWPLEPSLHRAFGRWDVRDSFREERERDLIRAFQRRAHHYISDPPGYDDLVEWCALLQHHGGPTRFLDVTASLFVATYFAVEDSLDDGIVWAFGQAPLTESSEPADLPTRSNPNMARCNEMLEGRMRWEGALLVTPFRMNERLAAQQGAFLVPGSVTMPLVQHLAATYESAGWRPHARQPVDGIGGPQILKLRLPRSCHSQVMRFLAKVNVTAASLFNGIEGYARALRTMLRVFD